MKAAQRIDALLLQLPSQQRIAFALAFADWSQELLTAHPPQKAKRSASLEKFAALSVELQELKPVERERAIMQRLQFSRGTYYRRLSACVEAGLLQSHSLTKTP